MNSTFRRAIAAALALILVLQNTGCGSAPTLAEVQMKCSEDARQLLPNSNGTASTRQAIFEYRETEQSRCALGVPPSRYAVWVVTRWSNGWVQWNEVTTDLSAEPEQRYLVLAYEKEKGQIPVYEVKFGGYRSAPAEALTFIVAVPVFALFLLFMVPAALVGAITHPWGQTTEPPKPTSRPSKDCCFVWIEHGATGEVLAGTAPQLDGQPPLQK